MRTTVDVHASKHEAFNNGDLDAAVSVFAESATYTDHARGMVLRGREAIKQYLAGCKQAFSDARCTDIRYLETEGATISLFTGKGTNDGPLGDLPPTGRSFAIPHCDIYEFRLRRSGRQGRVLLRPAVGAAAAGARGTAGTGF